MKFTFNVSPNLRQGQSTKRIMFELMLGLAVVYLFSLFYYFSEYGASYALQAVLLLFVALIVALVTESVFALVLKKDMKQYLSGSFGWITAIILTMMCKIDITPYALGVATFFSIFFGKLLFGGFGNNIFNPAAFGRAVIFNAFIGATTNVVTSATPLTILGTNFSWMPGTEKAIQSMMDSVGGITTLFTGWYPGAIGETSALLIIIVGIVLSIRHVIDWRVPTVYLISIFVLTAAVALLCGIDSYNGLPGFIWYPCVHVLSGGVVFGAVFMLTDPVTSPTSAQGRTLFALGAAIITVLIRLKANMPEGCLYSILIMNMLTPLIESAMDGKQLVVRIRARKAFAGLAAIGLALVLLAASVVTPVNEDPTTSATNETMYDQLINNQSVERGGSL
ncbi:RnfABCDGE type electron transport complex subunit D [Merdibacter massiliensis]|uniref:RnfABCDGE type electron transport complex subunit D n=1 Tax=Merdibacter massiliensis TaxID=1871030 RepID=UPI00096A6479|nr:RnfABCDGE type electron transport complex subunit D [Merdibacter massiliensis]